MVYLNAFLSALDLLFQPDPGIDDAVQHIHHQVAKHQNEAAEWSLKDVKIFDFILDSYILYTAYNLIGNIPNE